MPNSGLDSDILRYIIEHQVQPGENLPTMIELSQEMGVSVSKIREELAVARSLGLVQIKPRLGTQVQDFCFGPTATLSVMYALGLDRYHFYQFSQLRRSVELSFWSEAAAQLQPEDIEQLRELVRSARLKLNHVPIEVPFAEHRDLHLTFFKHLPNPFVRGILEAYWVAYQAFGLGLYADLSYHRDVWDYHERMVEHLAAGDVEAAYQALLEHMQLLRHQPDEDVALNAEERESAIHFLSE